MNNGEHDHLADFDSAEWKLVEESFNLPSVEPPTITPNADVIEVVANTDHNNKNLKRTIAIAAIGSGLTILAARYVMQRWKNE